MDTDTPLGYHQQHMQSIRNTHGYTIQRLLGVVTAGALFITVIWASVFCLLFTGAGDLVSQDMSKHTSALSTHTNHASVLSSVAVSSIVGLSEVIVALLIFLIVASFVYARVWRFSLRPVRIRKRQLDPPFEGEMIKHHWLSRFVRSPEFVRSA
jgi:hypothetical protein